MFLHITFKRQYDVVLAGIVTAAPIHRALLFISGLGFHPYVVGLMLLSTITAVGQLLSSKPTLFQPTAIVIEHFQLEFVRINPSTVEPMNPDGPPLL